MKKKEFHHIFTWLVTLGTIGVNIFANALPLNGLNTGQISDRFEIYFVPAGYVFSIWGLIYFGLVVYSVYQSLPSQRENPLFKKIAPFYWLSGLANIIWIYVWHYEIFNWTLLFMALILASLLLVIRNLTKVEGLIKWLVKLPFSIYLGWISVAIIANASQWLEFNHWGGWGLAPALWTVIMLGAATLLGVLIAFRENDTAYGLVLIWALIGITVSQQGTSSVVIAAWIGASLLAASILWNIFKNKSIY